MKFKLHNKYEITTKDKTIIAFNTLTKNVFKKISNLEEYTSRIAIGNGTNSVSFEDTKLSNFVASFETITEDICSDISKEQLFIKKLVTFDENDQSTLTFCELGLCSSSDENPDIYNHVLLKNSDNEIVSITKNPGDILQIRVTIYLELENLSDIQFYKGENLFIQQLLGENLQISDRNIYAIRGEYLAENSTEIFRPVPEINSSTRKCSIAMLENEDGSFTMKISSKLGAGETEEVVLVFANQVCLRKNILETLSPTNETITLSAEDDSVLEIGENIKTIDAVKNSNSEIISEFKAIKYGTKITDKSTVVFDTTFSKTDKRFVSKDGNKILFIKDNQPFLYSYENCEFKRIFCSLPTNVINVCMNQNFIVCILNQSPYIKIFEFENGIFVEKSVSLANFNITSLSYEWKSADCIFSQNEDILVGIVSSNQSNTSFVLKLSKNSNGIFTDTLIRTGYNQADAVFSISNSNFTNDMLLFVTSKYEDDELFGLEKVSSTGAVEFVGSSNPAFMILNNKIKNSFGGRIIATTRNDNTSKLVYLPDFSISNFNITDSTSHTLSFNGNYIILKTTSGFNLYNCHRKNSFTEFEEGYKDLIDESTAIDFEFVGDKILVFTSNENCPIYSVTIKENKTRLDSFNEQNASIEYTKYNVIGSRKDEGVQVELSLMFNQ